MTAHLGTPASVDKPKENETMRYRSQHRNEEGQILVIVAVGLVAIIAMVALVIDGGFAWAKQRDTQNAADAAANAGATVLMQNLVGVSPAKTDADVEAAVDQATTDNGTDLQVAYYTNIDGALLTPGGAIAADESQAAVVGDGAIPPGAAGVQAIAEQDFETYLASIVGFTELTAVAPATAVTGYLAGTCPASAGCAILPVTFPVTIVDCDGTNSPVLSSDFWPAPSDVTVIPLCAASPGNVGWIDWTPQGGGASELEDSIITPNNPGFDWPNWYFVSQTGNVNSVEDALRTWNGQVVQIPLFDLTCNTEPSGPGVDDCPPANVGGTGQNQWYHFAAMTAIELCSAEIPECVAAGFDQGAYVEGANGGPGGICGTGNGSTGCLVGRFVVTSYSGKVTAAPGPNPDNQTVGVQLVR